MPNTIRYTFALAILSIIMGCDRPNLRRIAFVTSSAGAFWSPAEVGAKAAAKEIGVNLDFRMPTGGVVEQKQIVEDLMTRGVDGIALSVIDPVNELGFVNYVSEKTRLVTVDSDAPQSNRLAYLGVDNYIAGRACGKLVKEAIPEGGKVFIFVGRVEQDAGRKRRQGVIDEILNRSSDSARFDATDISLKEENFEIVGTLTDQMDPAKAKANCEDIIVKHPDVKALVGLYMYNAPACLEALRQLRKTGQIKVIGFDEDPVLLSAIKDGEAYGTVVQDPYRYGYQSIKILNAVIDGNLSSIPDSKFIEIPAKQLRKNDIENFEKELAQKQAGTWHMP